MKTKENLMDAFAGESQANRKYLAFARKAEKEGYKNVGRIFQAIAEAETIHALKHFEIAGKINDTLENLHSAAEGENYEFTEMYPEFIETADKEDNREALKTFEYANAAEKVHGGIFNELKTQVARGDDADNKAIFLCPVCGWVGFDPAPDKCPICNTSKKAFKQF
ncbi:MAG: rubrerythrin family protein [Bacillota bacterium]|nr:rubrerythrin family protein [Bacillota bacterium]MDW7729629.1 rubrerythrin family protein [Bacillota bacterium]